MNITKVILWIRCIHIQDLISNIFIVTSLIIINVKWVINIVTSNNIDLLMTIEERLSSWASKPPWSSGSGKWCWGPVNSKSSVIEPPVFALFEKVCSPVIPLQGTINIWRKTPLWNTFWVSVSSYMRLPETKKYMSKLYMP